MKTILPVATINDTPMFIAEDASGDLAIWKGEPADIDPVPVLWKCEADPVLWEFLDSFFLNQTVEVW